MKTVDFKTILVIAAIAVSAAFTSCEEKGVETEPKTFTVKFECNGGSAVSEQTVTEGEKAKEPTTPTKTGHTFDGWYSDNGTFVYKWNFDEHTVTANVILYAKWIEDSNGEDDTKFSVTFETGGGSEVPSQTVKDGEKIIEPKAPTRNGFTFDAWYKEAGFTSQWKFDIDVVTANMTLHAKWIEDDKDGDIVKLVKTITIMYSFFSSSPPIIIKHDYDDKNRLTKMSYFMEGETTPGIEASITYNGNDLVKFDETTGYPGTTTRTVDFSQSGNIITIKDTNTYPAIYMLTLNNVGLPAKEEIQYVYDNDDVDDEIYSTFYFQYDENGNMTKKWCGDFCKSSEEFEGKYEKNKAPFYNCKTPKWWLNWYFHNSYWDINNNRTERSYNGHKWIYTYVYDRDGFPIEMTYENVEITYTYIVKNNENMSELVKKYLDEVCDCFQVLDPDEGTKCVNKVLEKYEKYFEYEGFSEALVQAEKCDIPDWWDGE